MDNPRIRVMIVDDHDMVRRGLAAFLKAKTDLELVGEARDGREALQVCEQTHPDVILMDLIMPKMGGAETTQIILEHCPEVHVIALTSFGEKELVQQVVKAIGPTAKPEKIVLTDALPKTRSGKIMRRILKALVKGETVGDTTTLMNPEAVEDLRQKIGYTD